MEQIILKRETASQHMNWLSSFCIFVLNTLNKLYIFKQIPHPHPQTQCLKCMKVVHLEAHVVFFVVYKFSMQWGFAEFSF